jgi:hypothetical protein
MMAADDKMQDDDPVKYAHTLSRSRQRQQRNPAPSTNTKTRQLPKQCNDETTPNPHKGE